MTSYCWCPVANVTAGTKNFRPGAKVYLVRAYWGTCGDRVVVVGRHRKSARFITVVMRTALLSNWRAAAAYHPKVIAELQKEGPFGVALPDSDEGRVLAEEQVASLRAMLTEVVSRF